MSEMHRGREMHSCSLNFTASSVCLLACRRDLSLFRRALLLTVHGDGLVLRCKMIIASEQHSILSLRFGRQGALRTPMVK